MKEASHVAFEGFSPLKARLSMAVKMGAVAVRQATFAVDAMVSAVTYRVDPSAKNEPAAMSASLGTSATRAGSWDR